MPCRDTVAGTVSLRTQDRDCVVESKSKDNVFTNIKVSIQYQVLPQSVDRAFYTLANPDGQIEAYVYNSIRGKIPHYDIDQIFLLRNEIAEAVKEEIDSQMEHYGYDIIAVLVTDIQPAASVTNAMNQINTNLRLRNAATDRAEGKKTQVIRAAEADAEAKRLSGVGLAEQRKAVVAGLQTSIEDFREGVQDLSSHEVMSLLLMNQYFDTLKDVASNSQSSTLFLQHAGGLEAVATEMTEGIIRRKAKK
jgi:regulator of protease activity HflC (stomatin/prohibitin superfamily)